MRRKTYRRKVANYSLIITNILVIIVILAFVFQRPLPSNNTITLNYSSNPTSALNPLDKVASANIALTVAEMANLPETTAIKNQAESQLAELAMASTANSVISKPQVVQTALKSRHDIFTYVVQKGDSVSSLASKFGVTSNDIMWSNNLNSGQLTPGQKLEIPPMNGIVYTVKSGNTIASLATKFNASQAQIVAYNDAEIAGIHPGEKILIPNGSVQSAAVANPLYLNWGGPTYGSNGYDFGYCTWYVASMISVPSNWGNANTWAYYASLSGWKVSSVPTAGAIAQTPYAAGGEGHVAIVTAVNANGSMIKFSDMNGLAGWGRVGYSGWVPASTFPNYITK